MANLLGSNIANSNRTRSDLTEPDPDGYPLYIQKDVSLNIEVTEIIGKRRYLNDTPIVSTNNHPNSIIYDADEAFKIDDMEDETDWSDQGTPSLTITADSTSGHYWVGTQGVNVAWTDTSGTAVIRSTESYGDFSSATGVSSGTPSSGTIGLWVYTPDGDAQSSFVLKIGSSASDYAVYSASFYSVISSFTDEERHLLLFDLDDPTSVTGTPDWTAIDWVQIEWTITAASNVTFDYFTVSKSDDISLCGAGERKTTITLFTETF